MSKTLLEKIKEYGKSIKEDAIYKRTFLILASIVIVFTLYQLMLPAITISQELICEKEEHTHTEECYKEIYICSEEVDGTDNSDSDPSSKEDESCYEKVLACEKEEHTHQEDTCYAYISKEAQALINEINEIPTVDELNTEIEKMYEEDKTAEEMEIYYNGVIDKVKIIYEKYNSLDETDKVKVTNIDKIETYYDAGLVSEELQTQTYATVSNGKTTFTIKYQNTYDFTTAQSGNGTVFGFTESDTTLGDLLSSTSYFYPFTIIVAQRQSDNTFRVVSINNSFNTIRTSLEIPGESLVFMVSKDDKTGSPTNASAVSNVSVNDIVTVSLNNSSLTGSAKSNSGVGTITFAPAGKEKPAKDNNSSLHVIAGADTDELIEVNLYDYGKLINEKYSDDGTYPGFQQPGGTTAEQAADLDDGDNYNFGDTISTSIFDKTVDGVLGKWKVAASSNKNINGFNSEDIVNRPISGYMYDELIDGYPALSDKKSLKYLFYEDSTYTVDKINSSSINGLFQYDEITGAYHYNSRENHAQYYSSYNGEEDVFVLYEEMITSNFIQYPFGNFFPLNNIRTQTTKASTADNEYINRIIDYAIYKANNTTNANKKTKYTQLYQSLINWDNSMVYKSGTYDSTYTAGEQTRTFFDKSGIPDNPTSSELTKHLENIYTIDFDEETNFFFGLEMKMNFMQPKNGLTGKTGKEQMRFYFTGDDDVWVYVDDVLFLDLSGIHRHVGGEIDFENGMVYYYALDPDTGDVPDLSIDSDDTEAEKTAKIEAAHDKAYDSISFKEILENAGKSTSDLNSKGTFKNYSTHSFNFYYMERGAGSGVMRMNFNMPLIEDNAITINKELTADDDTELLGNPDFKFQVLKPNGTLFIGANKEYSIYNDSGLKIDTKVTDVNGIITLKAGQHAVIAGIPENSGNYYVMELLDNDWVAQYGDIKVDGTTVTNDSKTNIEIGSDIFTGVKSPEQNISDGNTTFNFNNIVDGNKYGKLQISKKLVNSSLTNTEFIFKVTLDSVPLESGVAYKLCNVTRSGDNVSVVADSCVNTSTVMYKDSSGNTYGVIKLKKDQVAVIEKIYGGSKFSVEEVGSLNGFDVTYVGNNITVNNGVVSGDVLIESTVSIDTVNTEKEKADIQIPVTKEIANYDGSARSYKFKLIKLDSTTSTILEEVTVEIPKGSTLTDNSTNVTEYFSKIYYSQPLHPDERTIYNYRIIEVIPTDKDLNTKYDTDYIDVEVTVINNSSGFRAEITDIEKNGENISAIKFTNTLLGQLSIIKNVENLDGSDVNLNEKFDFKITLSECSTKEYTTNNGTITFNDSCEVTTKLGHGDNLIIYGLSPGIKYAISESSNGYAVTNTVNGTTNEGNEIKDITINVGQNSVQFINKKGYLLPETGGVSELIFGIIGSLLLAIPVIYIGYSFYKKERSVT